LKLPDCVALPRILRKVINCAVELSFDLLEKCMNKIDHEHSFIVKFAKESETKSLAFMRYKNLKLENL
tara:strand:- start:8 stop:211 length:204 start_codon:yes stop_codon:yes gene_type:complete